MELVKYAKDHPVLVGGTAVVIAVILLKKGGGSGGVLSFFIFPTHYLSSTTS